MPKLSSIRVALLLGLVLTLSRLAGAQSLAPTGTLRVSFLGTNPVQGRVDRKTGNGMTASLQSPAPTLPVPRGIRKNR